MGIELYHSMVFDDDTETPLLATRKATQKHEEIKRAVQDWKIRQQVWGDVVEEQLMSHTIDLTLAPTSYLRYLEPYATLSGKEIFNRIHDSLYPENVKIDQKIIKLPEK